MTPDTAETTNSTPHHPVDRSALDSVGSRPNSTKVSSIETCRTLASDIKIAHTVFALPFAVLACFLARNSNESGRVFFAKITLVIGCMIAARTAAMLANRILDRDLDAQNPRTKNRAVASGKVALRDATIVFLWASLAFIALTGVFGFAFDNWWPLLLALPVLTWICAYPLLKRFTALCHLYLGISLAISPLAAAIAVEPASIRSVASLWYLVAMVLTWVAGFDIIYALQDVQADHDAKLQSLPARFGIQKALWFSRGLHLLSIGFLLAATFADPRLQSLWFESIIVAVGVLLIIEHYITARHGTGKIQLTFFLLNGIISCLLGAAGILSVLTASHS